jgi:hypothetical protein
LGKSSPQQPTPPDPAKVAAAQSAADLRTSIGNAWMGNANEVNPYGSVTYSQTGSRVIPGDGTKNSKDQTVPTFMRTVSLSPEEQAKFDLQQKTQLGLNQIGLDQTNRIGGLLSSPVDRGDITPDWVTSLGDTNYEGARKSVEDAMYARINPQLDRDRNALESKLVNQGFSRGSEAFNTEMDAANRQATDARNQVVLSSGQEQSRLAGLARDAGAFQNNARQAGLQESLALRNQPINEITSLLSGGQVNVPQFQNFQYAPMPSTPVGQYAYQSAGLANQNYAQQMAQKNAEMAAIGQGAGALSLMMFSDRRLKKNIRGLGIKLRNGVSLYAYQYKGEDKPRVGVIAQEVAKVVPKAVHTVRGWLAVDYGKLLEAA